MENEQHWQAIVLIRLGAMDVNLRMEHCTLIFFLGGWIIYFYKNFNYNGGLLCKLITGWFTMLDNTVI